MSFGAPPLGILRSSPDIMDDASYGAIKNVIDRYLQALVAEKMGARERAATKEFIVDYQFASMSYEIAPSEDTRRRLVQLTKEFDQKVKAARAAWW